MSKYIHTPPTVLNAINPLSLTQEQISFVAKALRVKDEEVLKYYLNSPALILDYHQLNLIEKTVKHEWCQCRDISVFLSIPDYCQFMCKSPKTIQELIQITISSRNTDYAIHIKNVEFLLDNFLNQLTYLSVRVKEKQQHAILIPMCEYLVEIFYRCKVIEDEALMKKSITLFSHALAATKDFAFTSAAVNNNYPNKNAYFAQLLLPSLVKAVSYDKVSSNPEQPIINSLWAIVQPQIKNLWKHYAANVCHTLFKSIDKNHHSFWILEKFVNSSPKLALQEMEKVASRSIGLMRNYYYFFKDGIKNLAQPRRDEIIFFCFKYLNTEDLIHLSSSSTVPAVDIHTALSNPKVGHYSEIQEHLKPFKTILRARLDKEALQAGLPASPSSVLKPTSVYKV